MKFKDRLKQIPGSVYFLIVIIVVYGLLFIFNASIFSEALGFFGKIRG